MSEIVGIDLGTTNSCVAVLQGGEPVLIQAPDGSRTMPSMVGYVESGPTYVGHRAARQAVTNPEGTIWGAKRLIGRKLDHPQLQSWLKHLPYRGVGARNGDAWIRVRDRDRSPQEIAAAVLAELRQHARAYLGKAVTHAVITVPAYFTENQRQAVKDAGAIAGLKVQSVLNEPTAAALAYGVNVKQDQKLAVVDLGGGTFDVTVLKASGGVFQVLASNGDAFLGGDDFDRRLTGHLLKTFQRQSGSSLEGNLAALARITEASRVAKDELSFQDRTLINLPFIDGDTAAQHLETEVTRAQLEQLTEDLVERLAQPCEQALSDAKLTTADLDRVLLVGGMTRMPAVRRKVKQIFGQEPYKNINPDEAVALGAAYQCGILQGKLEEITLLDVTPHSLGIRVVGDRMATVIDRNTMIPTRGERTFKTTRDNQTHVDIEVYQGESEDARENVPLGRFRLRDLAPAAAGSVRVDVKFWIDADGLVTVTAEDCRTGRAAKIETRPTAGRTREQVAATPEIDDFDDFGY